MHQGQSGPDQGLACQGRRLEARPAANHALGTVAGSFANEKGALMLNETAFVARAAVDTAHDTIGGRISLALFDRHADDVTLDEVECIQI